MSRSRARSLSRGRRRTIGLPKFAEEPESPFSALYALSQVANENWKGTPLRVPADALQLTGTPFPTTTPKNAQPTPNPNTSIAGLSDTSSSFNSPPEFHIPSPDLETSPVPEPRSFIEDENDASGISFIAPSVHNRSRGRLSHRLSSVLHSSSRAGTPQGPFLSDDIQELIRTPERGRRALTMARRSLDFQFDAAALAADMTVGDETMASTDYGDNTMETVGDSFLGGGSPTERLPRMDLDESRVIDEDGVSFDRDQGERSGEFELDVKGMEGGDQSVVDGDQSMMGGDQSMVDFGGMEEMDTGNESGMLDLGQFGQDQEHHVDLLEGLNGEPDLVRSPLKRAALAEVKHTKRKTGLGTGLKKKYPIPEQAVKKLMINTGKVKQPQRDVLDAVMDASEKYFKMVANDLKDFASHAGRKTLNKNDVLLLMNRQRRTVKKKPLAIAARQYLPRELLQEFEG
ncbi:hypothetical protein BJ508DRAFT_361328 [Ascobolus immersus RN42]|uniref:CENP-T/Histone H4 histone fold domain-containing protein n=1 Tax=Ascobolus immersus RN42 TaxID=1160509 RepID=A0A3N4ICL0_ASCIM|nr:hypothetical protein BJ508DRAFT_361328 [Ascobolus immersus RN42]